MKRSWGLLVIGSLAFSACGRHNGASSQVKERWNSANDPVRLLPSSYVYTLRDLPLEGNLAAEPWADSYWPSYKGGLAQRWAEGNEGTPGHSVTPVSLETAAGMSLAQLATLSPAEKFDLYVGDAQMSLFNSEIGRTNPTDGRWFGICHGWAPASMAWAEPKAVIVKSPSGLEIPFGSTDIKALLSLYSADYATSETKFLASRCNIDLEKNPEAATNPECRDTNAGAFHLVLANLLGIQKQGFVADVTRDLEVWNQPVSGFKSQIISESFGRSPGAALRTVKEVVVRTEMYYGAEIDPQWDSSGSYIRKKVFNYRLEISLLGEIVGGEWLDDARPDFLWSQSTPEFVDSESRYGSTIAWSHLKAIYGASMAAPGDAPRP